MHVLRLPLKTTKYDDYVIDGRFYDLFRIHNHMVRHANELLRKLQYDKKYQARKLEYVSVLKKDKCTKEDATKKKQLSEEMAAIRKSYGLSKSGFESYLKVFGKRFSKGLSSQQVQKEADRVYAGVEKYLFSNGQRVHFKKLTEILTICGKTNTNGIKFDKKKFAIDWCGLSISCKIPKANSKEERYVQASLEHDISYCELVRKMFPNGWHYYVNIYLRGDAPKHITLSKKAKENTTGIDIGISTVAAVSNNLIKLQELAPKCKSYNQKIAVLQEQIDRSKRQTNPDKYNADGTIKKENRDKWVFSQTCKKKQRQLTSLYRQKAAYTKQTHRQVINKLVRNSLYFIVENMNFKAQQHRAKQTERKEKAEAVTKKDGTTGMVHKYKRKKRFGKSINDRAPASFVRMLGERAAQYGGALVEVDTKTFKASQYNHAADEYQPCKLSDRTKTIGGENVQRDLYSAFLLKNAQNNLKKPDRETCIYEFNNFVKRHNQLIQLMKKKNISMKSCFGF